LTRNSSVDKIGERYRLNFTTPYTQLHRNARLIS